MSKKHQKNLFKSHIADLKDFLPGSKELFACPICLKIFSFDSIESDLVDVGHVWPKYFRERSEAAKHQQVLLCKTCNSRAGHAGDEIMQEDAQLDEWKKTGKLGLRKLRVTNSPGQKDALHLEAFIQQPREKELRLSFPKYDKPSQQRYFGEQLSRFKDLMKEGSVDITVYPPRGKPGKPFGDPTNDPLAKAGYLTSAYLMAFHRYGYRYILQTRLDPVRDYIKESFDKRVDDRLDFSESKDICVRKCTDPTHFCDDPEIGFVISVSEEAPFHYEVRFLNVHIRLPAPQVFPDVERQHLILQLLGVNELPSDDGQTLQSISIGNLVASNIDHPLLTELQKS